MSSEKSEFNGPILLFILDELLCALLLSSVERVVRAVEVTPLPKAPEIVKGVINAQGRIIPVINIRNRFALPERDIRADDRFIIAKTPRRIVALATDSVIGVRAIADREVMDAEQALPFAGYLKGVAKTEEGLILIYDLDVFLSLDEENCLAECLAEPSS